MPHPYPATSAVVSRFARTATRVTDPEATDGRLLARFVRTKDEPAFAELVRRLGPMVLGVCRRVSGDAHLADDAFQAAFLVLARRAANVVPREAVRGWLYGVAVRTAREARTVSARRRARELPVPVIPDRPAPVRPTTDPDALAALDEEIAALSDHLRAAVVLCELDGVSRKDAAKALGIPEGTLSSRLAKARAVLAGRLKKRGVALPAALAAIGHATAAVPPRLANQATAFATTSGSIPPAIAALTNGVFRTMFLHKLKAAALGAVCLAACWVVASGLPGLSAQEPAKPLAAAKPAPLKVADDKKPQPGAKAADEKPLPKGPNKLLFWRKGDLTFIDPDGKNEKVVVRDMPNTGTFALSPDGSKVAVVRPPADGKEGLLHARLIIRELGKDGPGTDLGEAAHVAWSGDGTELAVCQYDSRKELADIRATHTVHNLATKKSTRLDLPENHLLTDWSRDGKFFLTTTKGGECVMNRDGTIKKTLTDERGWIAMGKFSPDARRVLLFLLELKQPRQILRLAVADVATGEVTLVRDVSLNGDVHGYCWSPDGKRIAYIWQEVPEGKPEEKRDRETESVLVVCDPDGGNPKTIATGKGKGFEKTLGGVDWR